MRSFGADICPPRFWCYFFGGAHGLQHCLLYYFISLFRCLSKEKEADSCEEDVDIKELKEQVVSLSSLLRQLQTQKSESGQMYKSQVG